MVKYYREGDKLISMFDVVRFFTSIPPQRFDKSILEGVNDYRIILTHGVIGELVRLIEEDCFGLDKSKLVLLCNNIETQALFNTHGFNTFLVSEYIFHNEDVYDILDENKEYDCIFPGRPSKAEGLFKKDINVYLCYEQPEFPFPSEIMPLLYNKAKCGLMTTEAEGSCLSVGEMLLCGIPVISVKINNNPPRGFYPQNKTDYMNTYGIVLPNTLGGRELWLDHTNSIFCDRTDESIANAIQLLSTSNVDRVIIRNNFLSKLISHRTVFMYVLKSVSRSLGIKSPDLESFVNLPYGNSTISSTNWNTILRRLL